MSTKLDEPLSLNAISERLQKDSRRIARALRLVEPNRVVGNRKFWTMETAERALRQYDRIPRDFRGRAGHHVRLDRPDPELLERAAARAEALGAEIAGLMADMAALDVLERRRRSPVVAKRIEAWGQALLDAAPIHERPLLQAHVDQLVGKSLANLMALCGWELNTATLR